jgi:ArsR family transcriptional regulator, arsenate/arsenite/antimonite-responsive transcriptional repressor
MLVEGGPEGLNAGTIAARLKLPPSSLTFHLQHLYRAGLISQERRGRELIYAADFDAMNTLVGYLTENCCAGASSTCKTECEPPRVSKKAAKKTSRNVPQRAATPRATRTGSPIPRASSGRRSSRTVRALSTATIT